MINPFEIIETDWVKLEMPYWSLETRIVTPAWIGWIIVKFNDVPLPRVARHIFSIVSKWAGLKLETRSWHHFDSE